MSTKQRLHFRNLTRGCMGLCAALMAAAAIAGEVPRNFTVVSNDAVTGSATLTKTGGGILYLGSSEGAGNTFSGDIVVGVDGGTLRLTGNANAPGAARQGVVLPGMTGANTVTVRRGSTFYIDDNISAPNGYLANRLGSEGARPALSLEGSSFTVNGPNTASLQTTQSVGQVTLASGASVITVARGNATATPKLIGGSLAVTPGAYAQFVGTTLGASALNVSQIYFTTAPSTVGGGGADGTPTKSIVPATRIGNDFVAYGLYGIRPLATSEYTATADINTAGNTDNVKFSSGALSALAGNKTVNALAILGGTSPWNMGTGYTLTLTSGQLLSTPNLTMAQGAVTAGAGSDTDLDIVPTGNTLTMTANLVDNGSGKVKLVKSGGGTLTLSQASDNTYSGGTVVNEGTLTMSTVAGRRYLGTGPVTVNNALLSVNAVGATANSTGADYTAIQGGQITLGTLPFSGDDTFHIGANSVILGGIGADANYGYGLPRLDRASNITLEPDAIVGRGGLSAPLDLVNGMIRNLGAAADLYYGLYGDQNSTLGRVDIGSGTAFKGISTDRTDRRWSLGTLGVAAGTSEIFLRGLEVPNPAQYRLYLGNGTTAGGPVISLAGTGTVQANVLGLVTLDDTAAGFGDTSAGRIVNFRVAPGAYLTVARPAGMGSGSGIATAQVLGGGSLGISLPDALNGDTTIEAGGRLVANLGGGLTGSGSLTFAPGSILHLAAASGFSGSQAETATLQPGAIIRLAASPGTSIDILDSRLATVSPVFELYGGNYWPANPVAAGTTILTLNRDGSGAGGMLVNDNSSRTAGPVANGLLVIGPNGGTIAATTNTTLTVSQPIALGNHALTIGSPARIDEVSLPKHGIVLLNAGADYSTAEPGSSITVAPGATLQNGAHALPDSADLVVEGGFTLAGADTIGSLAGGGTVNLQANTLAVGRNGNDKAFAGALLGTGAFVKTGAGRQDLTGGSAKLAHTGALNVNEGILALSGDGQFINSSAPVTVNTNATLLLDNTGTLVTNRLGTRPITLAGGTLSLVGHASADTTETVGAVTPGQGDSTIRVGGGTAAHPATLVLTAGGTRAGGATLHFEGLDTNNIIKYTTAQAGTVNGILPFGFVGSDFAVVANNTPVTAYGDYTTGDLGAYPGGTANFSLYGPQTPCTASKAVNAVKMTGGLGIEVASGTLTFTSGGIINDGGGDIAGAGSIAAGSAVWTINNTGDMTIGTAMTGTGGLVKGGAGRLTIASATAFTGSSYLTGGTLAYGIDDALNSQDLFIDGGATLDFGAYNDTNLGSVSVRNGRIIATGATAANSIVQASGKTLTLGGGPSGSRAAVDTGAGLWKLAGNPTFSETGDPGGGTISGRLDLNGATRTFTVGNSLGADTVVDLDVPAVLSGAAGNGLTKAGTGTLRLGGANTFDGPLNITGTLRLVHPQAHGLPSPTRALTINASSSLVLDNANGNIDVPGSYTLSLNSAGNTLLGPVSGAIVNASGTNTVAGAATLAGATTLASLAGRLTLSGDITGNNTLTVQGDGDMVLAGARGGTSTLTKNGAGTLTLTGASTFTGAVTLNAGVVNVRNNTAFGTVAGGVTTYIGSELQLQNDITIGAEALTLRGTGLANGGALRNLSGTNSYGGLITLADTSRINADAGQLTIDVASGSGITGTYNLFLGGAGDLRVADPIATSTGTLTKDGSGTVTLGGVNTFTGSTTVENGTLAVNGSIIAGSAVTVKDGAALGGTGACLGAVAALSGATVAPGAGGTAGGALTVGSLNLQTGSRMAFEFAATPTNDTVVVSGVNGLTIAPGTGVYLYEEGATNTWTGPGLYSLIRYSGTLNGSADNLAVLNPRPGRLYRFIAEDGWIKLRADLPEIAVLPASHLALDGARLNGQVLNAGGEGNPDVFFCWDTADRGTGSTSGWAHVDFLGRDWGTGAAFSNQVSGLLSGSNYTYRCFAANADGSGWSATAAPFRPLCLASVENRGAVMTGAATALLRGAVTDTGGETPAVWFQYWLNGEAVTNTVGVGAQAGACSTTVADLTADATYGYRLMASNLAGTVWSEVLGFTASTNNVNTYTGVSGGAWETASNWSLQSVPAASHTVVIPNGKTVTLAGEGVAGALQIAPGAVLSVGGATTTIDWRAPLDAARTAPVGLQVGGDALVGGNLAIGGRNQACASYLTVGGNLTFSNTLAAAQHARLAIYAGPVDGTPSGFQAGGAQVTVGGTTALKNAWIYPYCHQITGGPVVFSLQDVAIATDSGFNATGRGYALVDGVYNGPGAPSAVTTGGSHGGLGGNAAYNSTYGHAYAPFQPGSPGRLTKADPRGNGGGAIRIDARSVALDGKLLAEGANDENMNYGAGSGGGIWVTCSNLVVGANAAIRAVGGNATQHGNCGSGGGGRVAIMTDAPTAEQIESLYATGICSNFAVVTDNMLDPLTSPYPSLAAIYGGTNADNRTILMYYEHGKPGTAVWLRNRGDNYQVQIGSTPEGMPSDPPYGVSLLPGGETRFTALSPAQVYGGIAGSRLHCTGFTWSNALSQTGSGAATNVTLDLGSDLWLHWIWDNLEYRLTVRSGGMGAVVPDYSEWYADGSPVTLTAQADSGCAFLYWVGDVSYAQRQNAQITLTMDRPRMVIACFTAAAGAARSLSWSGGADSDDWFDPVNWDNTAIPGIHDSVIVTSGLSRVALPAEMTVASLTVARAAKLLVGGAGASATACAPIDPDDARPYSLTVTGNMVISNTAQVAMGGLNATSRVDLVVGGSLLLDHTAQLAVYAAYTGPIDESATYRTGGASVRVGGDTTLAGSSWIHPFSHPRTGAPVRFELNDLAINATAGINADYRGFGRDVFYPPSGMTCVFYGPGIGGPAGSRTGGSYGGQGGYNTLAECGYPCAPFFPGSAGRSWQNNTERRSGGGAIRIQANAVVLNGALKASGYGEYQYGGGSGGGIWITCRSLDLGPAAAMTANGGTANQYGGTGGGGGGRIAIGLKLTAAQIDKLYAKGTVIGLQVTPLADLPAFAGHFTVNKGLATSEVPLATDGTAVLTLPPPAGTRLILR